MLITHDLNAVYWITKEWIFFSDELLFLLIKVFELFGFLLTFRSKKINGHEKNRQRSPVHEEGEH
jgi:hypothetical protein